MRSTFGGIEISKRALFTQQEALNTTGHNVANANTRGYSRQVVNMVAAKPMEAIGLQRSTVPGQMGQSVEFTSITRVRENFLDSQYYNENKSSGEWNIRQDTLDKLEAIINEPSDTGVRQVVQNFWNAWQELSKAPDNLTARAVVKESALAMSDAFNHTSKQLSNLNSDLTDNINVKSTYINSTAQQVAALNNEIYRIEGFGNNANDLRDQRNVLLDDLSKTINITVQEDVNGYRVSMGAQVLVDGFNVASTVTPESLQGSFGGDLSSGEVYGMIYSRDKLVSSYSNEIDTMVKTLVEGDIKVTLPVGSVVPEGTAVGSKTYSGSVADRTLKETDNREITVKGFNGLHKLGYSMDNGKAALGTDFFMSSSGTLSAATLKVNPTIENDVSKIAASLRTYVDPTDSVEKVVRGNNDMSLLIAGLRDKPFNFDPTGSGAVVLKDGTVDEFFRAVVGQLGVQGQEAKRQATNQQVLVEQVEARRQSVSGVSMDEEMSNMIKFQHAYNAAARAMTVYDEALDKVINSMGVVGR
ncbi:flagellar hook-associated protein FlgK [Paenibacillus sp. WQ 127069]|uniref:Flagellar hook-associated protein 1 n=1 Tax=Paenibacillus baimaensis TaxID=2982185 RepID=A0ABT2UE87_9BACL|nr:flagellar hook-associated protein FlgK [Paenibacillus sp. WQ 127069]MCU6792946.1 flagellar hook-associated protein FlgK [Paenibacillus sp. WQ 127069]